MAADSQSMVSVFGSLIAARGRGVNVWKKQMDGSFPRIENPRVEKTDEAVRGEHTWNTAIGIDALVWLFLEIFELHPAGFIRQAEFFKNDQNLRRVRNLIYKALAMLE